MNHLPLSRLVVAASLGLCALGAAAQSSTLGAAPSFSALYVFGDSLSDSGNNLAALGGTGPAPLAANFIPALPYAPSGTYSNGPTWVSTFASGIGLPAAATASLQGGNNYAYGGATTSTTAPPAPFPPSLQAQVGSYLSANTVDSSALYVIAGGGNDARAVADAILAGADPQTTTIAGATAYATTTATLVGTLRAAGASNIVVWNVPDLGKTPAAGAGVGPIAAGGTQIASAFNSALSFALASSGVTIFDSFGLIGTAVSNPAAYGFGNVTQACGFAGNGCDASTALFWDGIHPTAFAHGVIASQMLAVVAVPEPGTVWLFMAGLAGFAAFARRRQLP